MEARSPQAAPVQGQARLGAIVAAIGGVVLFVSLFVPWYTLPGAELADTPIGDIAQDIGGAVGIDVADTVSRTGWESFEFTDILAAFAAFVVLARLGAMLASGEDDPPIPGALFTAVVAGVALALVGYRFVNPPWVGFNREIGVWLALIAAGAMAYGSVVAMRSSR